MTKFAENIKNLFDGWKPWEIAFLGCVLVFIIANAVVVQDSSLAVISAIFGILYTLFAGKGKVSCFFFGLLGSGCYAAISCKNALWGQLLLYLGYYVPMQIAGIFQWNKNLKSEKNEIVKTKLSFKELVILAFCTILALIITISILYYLKDSSPVIDGVTTILSVVGMYLTVKRCIEQWTVWMIVNGLSAIMWANLVFLHGSQAFSTVIMWSVYFLAAIYFFFQWKKEVKI